MLDLIKEKNNNSIYPYVQLVDDYKMIGDLEKAKYYYDLGMQQKNLEDLDVLEERKDYFNQLVKDYMTLLEYLLGLRLNKYFLCKVKIQVQ